VVGAALAGGVLADVTASGRPVVVGATVVGCGAALAAADAARRERRRLAGGLLVLSAVVPTGFAYLPNVVVLVVGLVVLLRPVGGRPDPADRADGPDRA
jgi:hypothetical protein